METIERGQFTLFNGPNGQGTFHTFLNLNIEEVRLEHFMIEGDVSNLHVLVFHKWQAEFEQPQYFTFEDFKNNFIKGNNSIQFFPNWDVEIVLGIRDALGKFVGLSDNVHLNFPGMGGNSKSKINYSSIRNFKVTISYSSYRNEPVF